MPGLSYDPCRQLPHCDPGPQHHDSKHTHNDCGVSNPKQNQAFKSDVATAKHSTTLPVTHQCPSDQCQRVPLKLLLQPSIHTASNQASCHGGRLCLCHWTRLCRSNVIPPHQHGVAVLQTLHATKPGHLVVTITWHAQPLTNQGPGSKCTCRHQQDGSNGQRQVTEF
jgi:hypothetical protein